MADEPKIPLARGTHDDHVLKQMHTPFTNSVLKGPEGSDIGDLVCELSLDPHSESIVTFSAWGLSAKHCEMLAAGAHLKMGVWQHPIPPLALTIEAPFCVCGCETVYVKSERAFACPNEGCLRFKLVRRADDDEFKPPAEDADTTG